MNIAAESIYGFAHNSAQNEMFPLETIIEGPNDLGTADLEGLWKCKDTHWYYVKHSISEKDIRLNEWLASDILDRIGVAVPPKKVIQSKDGRLLFGSRQLADYSDKFIGKTLLHNAEQVPAGCKEIFSCILTKIYIADLFINNVDRHEGNYLIKQNENEVQLCAIDHARSLMWNWPVSEFPYATNTMTCSALFVKNHGLHQETVSETLRHLKSVNSLFVRQSINSAPQAWRELQPVEELCNWWSSSEKDERIEQIARGMENGTLI